MQIYWDIKVNATSVEEAKVVLNDFASFLGLLPFEVRINLYPKFPEMFECLFSTSHQTGLSDAKQMFERVGKPLSVHEGKQIFGPPTTFEYDALIDSRVSPTPIKNLFWAHIDAVEEIPNQ